MSQPPFNPFEAQLDRDAALSIWRTLLQVRLTGNCGFRAPAAPKGWCLTTGD